MTLRAAPVFAALFVVKAAAAWLSYRAQLTPDTALYVSGDPWWYPSPGGRLLGLTGLWGLAALNALAAGALAWMVCDLAERWGASTWLAGLALLLLPAGYYTVDAGVDTVAAALIVAAVLYGRDSFGFAAAVIHPASAVGWALWRLRPRSWAAAVPVAVLWVFAVAMVLGTPYRGIFSVLSPAGLLFGLATVGIGLGGLLVVQWAGVELVREGKALTFWLVLAGGAEAGMQGHLQVRYLLPATAVVAARVTLRLVGEHVPETQAAVRARARERYTWSGASR